MSDFKVRLVDEGEEPKSAAEIEAAVIAEAEASREQEAQEEHEEEQQEQAQEAQLDDSIVLKYVGEKLGRDVSKFEDLVEREVVREELDDEEVKAFHKYKKETGRGIEDFLRLNKDFDSMEDQELLINYIKEKKPHYTREDILSEIEDKYSYDEEIDEERLIKQRQREKKDALVEAKGYFESQKEKYKVPLESREKKIPDEEVEEFTKYKESIKVAQSQKEEGDKKAQYFLEKTNEVFSDDFEGFYFNVNDDVKIKFKPAEASALKKEQSNVLNFINKFLDENGYIKDAKAFHRAISVATDPDKFAKVFYEKGMADQAKSLEKDGKNIDMVRSAEPNPPSQGFKVRAIESSDGDRIVIRKR